MRPVPIVRVPPMSLDPVRKQHLSPVWMRMLCPFRLSFVSSKAIRPAFALRRSLSNVTTPGAVSTYSFRACVSSPEASHAASSTASTATGVQRASKVPQ